MHTIRDQVAADDRAVEGVLTRAFADEPEVADLEVLLARRPDSVGFVALAGDEVVGHVRLTPSWVDADARTVEVRTLGPLSVDPSRQREGIGRALVDHALGWAERQGTPAVFLEGDPAYYGRLGWIAAARIGVEPPSGRIPRAACQVALLSAYEPWMRGRLVYADTFWAVGAVGLRGDVLDQVRRELGEDEEATRARVAGLERELLDPAVRGDARRVERLLDADFREFGASGQAWDRAGIIAALAAEPGFDGAPADVDVRLLTADVALVTYRIAGPRTSLRSSVWVRDGSGDWRLRFHQGTRT